MAGKTCGAGTDRTAFAGKIVDRIGMRAEERVVAPERIVARSSEIPYGSPEIVCGPPATSDDRVLH
jgi:hypothetical protein